MSSYSPTFSSTFQVEGDEVTVVMKRLTRGEFGKITPFMPADPDNPEIPADKALQMMEVFAEFLPEKIVSFKGLVTKDGDPIEFKEALETSFFYNLIMEIIVKLMEESTLNEKKEQDSNPV